MSNGGSGPIKYKIGRIPSIDIWAWTLGFECHGWALTKRGKQAGCIFLTPNTYFILKNSQEVTP
jgi:hypothetical protein